MSELAVASDVVAPPLWAAAYGLDVASPFPFAELELPGGVVMRLRWIPPGRFQMGSPEDEFSRWSAEGPQRIPTGHAYWTVLLCHRAIS